MRYVENAIIGAGPSGLSSAIFLKENALVLESSNMPGGGAGSVFESGFTFDYGPHIMFSKNIEVLDYMIRLLGTNVHKCKRNNKVSFENNLIKYPFENDLSSISPMARLECTEGYFINRYKEIFPEPSNLKEWLLHTFGDGICKHYLFPYNEKVWNLPVEELSMLWADRIPRPPPVDVLKSALGVPTEGYLHQLYYHYPLTGGYQAISEEMAKRCRVQYGFEVNRIEKLSRGFKLFSSSGQELESHRIISTMPIHRLVHITNLDIPADVRNAVSALIANPMYVISLGIQGVDEDKYTAIYFPEPDFLVNRISYPGTFSPKNCPIGTYSIQAEITFNSKSKVAIMTDDEILEHVIRGLESRGILHSKNILYKRVDRREYAYVVYDRFYEANVELVRHWFKSQGIILNGRFGHFEYLNVDGIIELSRKIISSILGYELNYLDFN